MLVRGQRLTFDTFENAVHQDGSPRLTLDLSRTTFVDAYGLVAIATLIEYGIATGLDVAFVPPSSRDCRNYVSRMHLGERLEELGMAGHGLPPVGERDLGSRLVEIRPFTSPNEVRQLAELLFERLSDNLRTRIIATELFEAMFELGGNALEHGQCDRGFVAAQVYNRGRSSQYIVFAVGDAGIGIRNSLSAADYEVPDDVTAVELALQRHVTASPDPHRGLGLPDVVDLIAAVGGRVLIRTGEAKVSLAPNRQAVGASHTAGTLVAARIGCGARPAGGAL